MDITVCLCDHRATQLGDIRTQLEAIMTALDNLQAADAALKAEVTVFLADIAARLGNSPDEAAIQAVADDVNAEVAALQAADPAAPAADAPPAG